MIRVIIRTDSAYLAIPAGGAILTTYRTIDIEAPEIERALMAGGRNPDGSFEHVNIVGIEVLP